MITEKNSATYYIDQKNGNDRNDGFYAEKGEGAHGPLTTAEEAVKRIAASRQAGIMQPIRVYFVGDYYLTAPITIDESVYAVEFTSSKGGRATVYGGRRLRGFAWDEKNGKKCLSVALPEVARDGFLFSDLYHAGKRMAPARFPEEGTFDAVTSEFPHATHLSNGSHWFIAKKEDLAGLPDVADATVNFVHYWIDEHTPIAKYDSKTGRIDLKYRSTFEITTDYEKNLTSDLHYYLENVGAGLTCPGQWYLDVKASKLYVIPTEENVNPAEYEVFVPLVDRLVTVRGARDEKAHDIAFVDLDFAITRGEHTVKTSISGDAIELAADGQSVNTAHGAINFEHATDCAVEHCTVKEVGLQAVNVGKGCHDIRIERCHLHDLGAGGIRIGGAESGKDARDFTSHVSILKNKIHDGGQRYAAGCGVLSMHCHHLLVSENDIFKFNYTGVSVGWCWNYTPSNNHHNRIERNHIHHLGDGILSDMGGIYTLGLEPGTVLVGNVIHDVSSNHYGGWGIYPDEGSSFELIKDNLVFDTKCESYHQHYGSFNTVRDNVFAYGKLAILRNTRMEDHLANLWEDNVFLTRGGVPIYNEAQPIETSESCRNVICDEDGAVNVFRGLGLSDFVAKYGHEEETVEKNPEIDVYALAKERVAAFKTVDDLD